VFEPLTCCTSSGTPADDDVTVRVVEPLTEPEAASTVEVPAATAVAKPPVVIVATLSFKDDQTTEAVRFCVLLSL
jgi:hypothetical protein